MIVELSLGETATVFDTTVTFQMSSYMAMAEVNKGPISPEEAEKRAMIVLAFARDGMDDQAIVMEGKEWGRDLEALGVPFRVLTPPEIGVSVIQVEFGSPA